MWLTTNIASTFCLNTTKVLFAGIWLSLLPFIDHTLSFASVAFSSLQYLDVQQKQIYGVILWSFFKTLIRFETILLNAFQ